MRSVSVRTRASRASRSAPPRRRSPRAALLAAALALSLAPALPARLLAQWSTTYESFYLPGRFNWEFRRNYAVADRLFNAFDFGHAILYEVLWTDLDRSARELEGKWYDRLTREILVRPPRVPLEESAIEIAYAKLVPEAKQMFDWAHLLHRQIYDVWADERMTDAERDAKVAELLRYYRTRPDLAFSARPKSMVLMQEQPYSLAFRTGYPKFNGLIWAYHWLQVGLYEPLLTGRTPDEKQARVRATVARFWQMLQQPPRTMPHLMPMTAAIAPTFAARYPEAAIIFDNLHSMHDVVSDVLANPSVPRERKRAEILLAARRFRDDTSFVMTEDAWRTMTRHMGIENMGGPSVDFLPDLPAPTVTYGAVMTHDDRTGEMTGFAHGEAVGGGHAAHGARAAPTTAADPHAAHRAAAPRDTGSRDTTSRDTTAADPHAGHAMPDAGSAERDVALYVRLLEDPAVRRRVLADTAMRRLMEEAIRSAPAEHREHLESLLRAPLPAAAPAGRAGDAPRRRQPAARPRPPRPAPVDPHAGHRPPPKAPPKKP